MGNENEFLQDFSMYSFWEFQNNSGLHEFNKNRKNYSKKDAKYQWVFKKISLLRILNKSIMYSNFIQVEFWMYFNFNSRCFSVNIPDIAMTVKTHGAVHVEESKHRMRPERLRRHS